MIPEHYSRFDKLKIEIAQKTKRNKGEKINSYLKRIDKKIKNKIKKLERKKDDEAYEKFKRANGGFY